MRVIGLTGGIASGKSTVAFLLAKWGFPVIDADQVAREVVAPETPGFSAVRQAFGNEIIGEDGTLDRRALRLWISQSQEAQQILNGILHPLIRERIRQLLEEIEAEGHAHAFVEAALLVETDAFKQYDGLLLVTANRDTRLARLEARDGMTRDQAEALMARQFADDKKRAVADAEVQNDGSLEELEFNLRRALREMGIPLPKN